MDDLWDWILGGLAGSGVTLAAVRWVIKNRNAVIRFLAWLFRTFHRVSQRLEYGNVSYNIEVLVNTVGENFNIDAPDALPYPMKIEWSRTGDEIEAHLREGEIIVALDYSPNRDRNLVVGTMTYLRKGLLPRARPYTDKSLMTATEFTVGRSVFAESGQETAFNYFFENFVDPATERDSSLRERLSSLERLQDVGFFSRVLLRELRNLGVRLYPAVPKESHWSETIEFTEFLERIANRERGVYVSGGLAFFGQRIRANLLLVAAYRTKIHGLKPYLKRIQIERDRGVQDMYVFARGGENIELADQIVSESEDMENLTVVSRHSFQQVLPDGVYNAVCIICRLNLRMRAAVIASSEDVLYQLLLDHVDEIADGKIEIVGLARAPGVCSKIAVRSLVDGLEPVKCCTEERSLLPIETSLGDEELHFIQWSADPRKMILSALFPLSEDDVIKMSTKEPHRRAKLEVGSWKAKRKACGKGDINLRLAMAITDWNIHVVERGSETC